MRHRRTSSALPTRAHRATVGLAAVGLLASSLLSAPGAIAEPGQDEGEGGSLTWFVQDESGAAVHSTTFRVTGPDGFSLEVGDNLRDDTNTTHGTVTVDGLPLGEYTIAPDALPEGMDLGEAQTAVVGEESGTPITFVAAPVIEDAIPTDEAPVEEAEEPAPIEEAPVEEAEEPAPVEEAPVEEAEEPAPVETEEPAPADASEESENGRAAAGVDATPNAGFAPMAFPTPAPVPNPELPEQCGLDIAIVLDLSNSLSNNDVAASKSAAQGFVDVLQGTPSSVGVYTFASYGPDRTNSQLGKTSIATGAGADQVRQHISDLERVPSGRGGTNWDYGFSQIPTGEYDVIVFVTDGNPTAYGQPGSAGIPAIPAGNNDLGTSTDQIDIDRGTASSNTHKNAGSFVIGLGVGNVTAANIRYISGDRLNTDYFLIDDYEELAAKLAEIALEYCAGTLTVVKQVRGLDGQLSAGQEWTFSTTTDDVSPESGLTDENGALNFEVDGYTDVVTSREVTIAETQQPGFVLEQQDGANASCYNTVTGQAVGATNAGGLGFTVSVPRDGSISCTVINAERLENPTITKTAEPAYQVAHLWDIAKDVDQTRVTYPEGAAVPELEYTIAVTPLERLESEWTVTGEITVTNPNAVGIEATLTDVVDNGGDCQLDAATVVVAPGVNTYPYTCTYGSAPTSPAGQNTATLQWDAAAYPGTDGQVSTTVPFDFDSVDPDPNTNETITVVDDLADESPWTITWPADGSTVTELTYTVPATGTPGECTTIDNTATITETDQSDSTETEVCVGADLAVTKNVIASLDRTYSYELDKDVNETRLNVDPETGEATFTYTVTVTDGPAADDNWQMTGEITVSNPNAWPLTADVTDEVDNGGTCTVDGGTAATIPANDTATFGYECTFTGQPDYDGTNTATVSWDAEEYFTPSDSASFDADFEAADWNVTPINQTVTVIDDQTDPANPVELGEHTWTGVGETEQFSYDLTLEGVAGECIDFTNTAWLEELPGVSDEQDVTVCWPLDLSVSKTVDADFDREYLWLLEKDVDKTSVVIGEDGLAEFNYTVTATPVLPPNGYVDSGWTMSGQITITNPNSTAVTSSISDVPDVGGGASCVVEPQELTVPAQGTATAAYSCSFESQPDYQGTNTASISWTDVNGEAQSTSTTEDVDFELDEETNLEVQVWDDKVTGEAPGELLGTAIWNEDGTPTEFEYRLDLPGEAGTCVDHTNTAVIPMTGDEAEETVTVCSTLAPEVTKEVEATFDRLYTWELEKVADDPTEVTVTEDGTHQFDYTVRARPDEVVDSNWAMSGQITVTNPNTFADGSLTVTVTDVPGVGGECTVVDGEDVVLAPGEVREFDYTCAFDDQPAYEGENVAHVAWAGPEQTSGTAQGSDEVDFDIVGETDFTVEVWDDKTNPEEPVLLGVAVWDDPDTHEFTYPLELGGTPGTCTDQDNNAWLELAAGPSDPVQETVTVCVEAAPEVTKDATASFDREYFWDIAKDVDATEVEISGTEALFNYTVTTTPAGFVDSGWELTGAITVTNPNDFQELTVSVTDVADVGGECTVVDGEDVVLAAGETVTLDYSCSFTEQPAYAGTNTAYVAWTDAAGADQTETAEADVVFAVAGETNLTVDVYDDKVTGEAPGHFLGTSHYDDGPFVFEYDLPLPGTPGECVTHTNTAVIPATGDEAEQDVTICVEDGLVITKTVDTAFDREFLWDLAKEADQTELTIGEDGTATFNYTVTATPDPEWVDSGWQMTGQISVTNPNLYDEGTVTVEITDESTVGGTCAVTGGQDAVIAPGATEVFDYACTFGEQPAYDGTNTATVTWTGPEGEERSVTTEVPVTFQDPVETNRSVDVHDDKVTGLAPGEYLGTAEWNAAGTPISFEYSLDLPGEPGTCVDHTNTAVILMTDEEAEETVTVCSTLAPEVSKTAAADFDREYDWTITKAVDRTRVVLTEDGTAEFNYVVSAIPGDFTDSGWTMGGQVTVTNPNTFDGGELTVTVIDLPSVGGECAVADGEEIVLAPSQTRVFDYTCTFTEQPEYAGTNLAQVAWVGPGEISGTVSAEADVEFLLDEETNREVEVYDDKVTGDAPGELLGTAIWNGEGTPTEFEYSLDLPGVVGSCVDYTNTAVLQSAGTVASDLLAVGDQAEADVTVCIEAAPEVGKTAGASYDREYFWDLAKVADATEVEITEDGNAIFNYLVTATPGGFVDTGWEMAGEITVTNPNDFQEMAMTVTDVATVGGSCVVAEGEDVVLDAGETRVLPYECTFGAQPDYEGSNTAYVTWTDADGTELTTASAPVEVVFGLDEETNREVEVYDDKVTGEAPGELLGTAEWNAEGTPTEFAYELELEGVVGECVDYTNTAVIPATGDEADATVTVCVQDELVITKTAEASFDRTYDWELAKEADQTEVTIAPDGTATFNYAVSATPDGFADSNWAMSGQISVTNPNAYDEGTVTVEITDESTVGGTCAVIDGADVVLAPGETRVFDYECTFTEQPSYDGTNTATVTWTGPEGEERSVTTEVPVSFELAGESNASVEVYDDLVTGEAPGELLGTAIWNEDGTPTVFEYALDLPGEAGTCVDHTNTAVIPATGDDADETVSVCVEIGPEVSKTADASYDRSYDWELAKEADRTVVELPEPGTAEFTYLVTATPDGYTDSGWEMSGQVTVTNPNDFQELVVTVSDEATVGGSCVVADGEDVVLAAGETRVLTYECSFTEQPEYEGSNTAVVTWTDIEGAEQVTSSEAVEVSFELDQESNLVVEVYDDMVTGEAPGELLGTADWRDGPTEFTYSLALEGVADECVDYTNTAVIPATEDEAQETVRVCVVAGEDPEPPAPVDPEPPAPVDPEPPAPVDPEPPAPVDPEPPAPVDPAPPAPVKPVIPTGDPVSSGPQLALVITGLTAMILALLGAAFFLRRRQD